MGRPLGSQNKDKRFKAALVRYAEADPKRLDDLAAKLWTTAMKGDVQAMVQIRDTLDGRPAQAIVGDDEYDPVRITRIENVIIDPKDQSGEDIQPAS